MKGRNRNERERLTEISLCRSPVSLSLSFFLFLAPLIFFRFPLVLSVLNRTKIPRGKDRDWERKRGIGRKRESQREQEGLRDISHGRSIVFSLSLYIPLSLSLCLSLSTSLEETRIRRETMRNMT